MSGTGTFPAGTLIGGRHRIEEALSGEGSAAVYRATDTRLQRAVALRARVSAGGALAARRRVPVPLAHPHVAPGVDAGADTALGVEYVAAELGAGGSLAALLAQRGAPPAPLALRMVQEAAAGVAAAHAAGLVHGDLHPGMLWLTRDEGRLRVQVLGLGLDAAGAPLARATARYAAPERLRRVPELAPAADVFSLGVIAFEVFAGMPAEWTAMLLAMARGQAAAAPSLAEARPDLPAQVADAVRRALLADPAARWADAGAFAACLLGEPAAAPARPAVLIPAAPLASAMPDAPAAAPADADPEPVMSEPADQESASPAPLIPALQVVAAPEPEPVAPAQPAEPMVAADTEPVASEEDAAAQAIPFPVPVFAEGVDVVAPAKLGDAVPPVEPVAMDATVPQAAAPEPEPIVAPPVAPRQAAVRAPKPLAAARTDLAGSLYIPPALEKPAPRPEPAPAAAAAAAPATQAPPVTTAVPAEAQPATAPPAPAEAEQTIHLPHVSVAAPVVEPAAPVAESGAPAIAAVPGEEPVRAPIPVPARRRPGLARLGGQPAGSRRGLLAAGIAVAVIVGGGIVAKTVLAGSSGTPAVQGIAAQSLAPITRGAVIEPRQAQANTASEPAADSAAANPALTADEQRRQEEERRRLEEQRRQQRQQDSLRQAQLASLTQAQAAPPQVALAVARPPATAPAPQIETRAEQPAAQAAAPPQPEAPPAAPARRADASRVYGGGEVDQAPSLANGSQFRSAVQRTYPGTLRGSGQWGSATVSFVVGADGRVERSSVSVEQASHPAFRAAATAAIANARFNPARVDGQPVRAQVSMPITWQDGNRE